METKSTLETPRLNRRSHSVTWLDAIASKYTIRTVWTDGDETTGVLSGNYYTFTGRRFDPESELMYFRNRYYSAGLGRFMGRDPLGYSGGLSLYNAYFVSRGTTDMSGLSSGEGIVKEECEKQEKQFWRLNPSWAVEVTRWETGLRGRKPCPLKIECVPCCTSELCGPGASGLDAGGCFKGQENGRGGRIYICYENEKVSLYGEHSPARTLAHELRHYLDYCEDKWQVGCEEQACLEKRALFAEAACYWDYECINLVYKLYVERWLNNPVNKCRDTGWPRIKEYLQLECPLERPGKPVFPAPPAESVPEPLPFPPPWLLF